MKAPRATPRHARAVAFGLALVYLALCVIWTRPAPVSWNDIARVAAVESLSERGTWAIDASPWSERTQDKVFLNGRFYSDKMPLMSWVGAGIYGVARVSGVSLGPDCASVGCAYALLTLLLCGLPAAGLIAAFFLWNAQLTGSVLLAGLVTGVLGLGTMILPYSLVLNHHLPAAASLFGSFYLLTTGVPTRERLAGAGFLAILAPMLDPLAGILALALGFIAVWRTRRQALYFVAGASLPLVLTAWLDWQIAGTLLPPYMIPEGYTYEGSVFPATVGGNGTPDDLPQYAFKMFFGAQGLLAYNPVLLFGLAGLGIAAFQSEHRLWGEAVVLGIALLALAVYLATRTGNLGGEAYGERWFVQAIPLVMAFSVFCPPLSATASRAARMLTAPIFTLVVVVSLFSSLQGARNPWRFVPPPFHPTRNAQTGEIGWRDNVRLP